MNLPPVRQLSPTISAPMEQVITKALEHDSNRRWQSVEEIRRHLGTVRQPVQPPMPVPSAGPTLHQAPVRPTTKLLLAMAQMSNTQLAVMAGGLLVLFAVGTWLLAPVIKSRFPLLWRNFPLYLIAGPLAYAAARRRGTAFAAHVPISSAVWWILHTRFGGTGSFWPYIVALVLGGAVEEGWVALEKKEIADIWWQDCLWFAAMASLAVIVIKVILQQAGLDIVWIGEVIGAALVGALGWFIGDLYQQHLYLRQTGVRRSTFR